jgi:quinol monooxygenase YgiN
MMAVMANDPSYATLATFRMDPHREEEQLFGLQNMIVPGVRQHPGFVAGTWTRDRSSSESYVMLTFETHESAEAMRQNVIDNSDGQREVGVELIGVRVLEVTASTSVDAS